MGLHGRGPVKTLQEPYFPFVVSRNGVMGHGPNLISRRRHPFPSSAYTYVAIPTKLQAAADTKVRVIPDSPAA
jgi:hypothetical protein